MAKFDFRLQNFLRLKEKLEEQAKVKFGAAAAALEREKKKKAALELDKTASVAALRDEVQNGIAPSGWAGWNGYIEALKRKIAVQQGVIDKAAEYLEEKRLELTEAMRERKTIETLRDKALEEYGIEEKKAERKLTDELVASRFAGK
jgi:flagellar FliJ protein